MLRVMTFNMLEGGNDRVMGDRTEPILSLMREQRPDITALIEANGFEHETRRRIFEDATGTRAIVALAPTGFHVAILVRRDLDVLWHAAEPGRFFHAALALQIQIPGPGGPTATEGLRRVTVVAAHLDPFSPESRLAEVRALARHGNPRKNVLLMGDFNALPSGDPVDSSVLELPPRILARHIGVPIPEDGPQIDTRAHDVLKWVGFEDLYRRLNPKKPGWTLLTTRFAAELRSRMRMDYIYGTEAIAVRSTRCEVLETDLTRRASDHYPIVAEFDL